MVSAVASQPEASGFLQLPGVFLWDVPVVFSPECFGFAATINGKW